MSVYKKVTFVLFHIFVATVIAQNSNQNVFKGGLYYDRAIVGYNDFTGGETVILGNKFGYIVNYERYLGSRIGLNVSFHKYFGSREIGLDENSDTYSIRHSGVFSELGYGLSYESRYYFDAFDSDGGNSGFLGIVFQHNRFKQNITDASVTYYGGSSSPQTINFADYETNVSYNRLGLRIGAQYSDMLCSELYFAVYYNFVPTPYNHPIKIPTYIPAVSIGITYLVGIPF